MRVRDHVALSSAGAALLCPLAGRDVLAPWAASILIDVDHFLWFCLRRRSADPRAAFRFFQQAEAPHHAATRLLHRPGTLLALLSLGTRSRWARAVALGMALHVALDVLYETRMDEARAAALRRDGFTCQRCGTLETPLVAHLWQQPRLLPSYDARNLVTLCGSCHEAAHG